MIPTPKAIMLESSKNMLDVKCEVDYNQEAGNIKLTQPVMIQSFQAEIELQESKASNSSAIPRTVMSEGELKNQENDKTQSTY
jgi:hypothetical protein